MPYKILIVDDDIDFNSLLTDVFRQADYDVVSINDAREALAYIEKEPVDLIVSDQRMPGMDGTQLVKEIADRGIDIPVVMVSGFLKNDMIRELIRDGIGGIFMKPLNVFSLLKRTSELIEAKKNIHFSEKGGSEGAQAMKSLFPFPFKTFSGKSKLSLAFVNKLYALREFASNLLLIGHEGADFEGIFEDFIQFDSQVNEASLHLNSGNFDKYWILEQLNNLSSTHPARITVSVEDLEKISLEESLLLVDIARKKPPFDLVECPVRFVYWLHQELDFLFEQGIIDDNLYMFLGTNELRIPRLVDIPEEIGHIGRRVLERDLHEEVEFHLSREAIQFCEGYHWSGDYKQFRQVLITASQVCRDTVILADDIRDVLEGKKESSGDLDANLAQYLQRIRDEYLIGCKLLGNESWAETARQLGVSIELVKQES